MTEKRFYYNIFYYPNSDKVMEYEIIDRETETENIEDCWYIYISENDSNWQDMLIDKLNELHEENQALKQSDNITDLETEIMKLREENKELIKQVHLIHISSMFSTVKSFKGDVSQRYKYNEETDTIYDTANKYGRYNAILDKKKVTMLLNEYNTLLENNE